MADAKPRYTVYLWIGANCGTANKKVSMASLIRARKYFGQCKENPLYTSGELVRQCPETGDTVTDKFNTAD